MGFGVLLRVAQYLFNRSLWLDEAMLANNMLSTTFWDLFKPLGDHQAAPIGFLIVEKSLIQLGGSSEYVLRLFPLLCGVIPLFLFYRVAVKTLEANAVPIALILFSVSDQLIYFSSELKQYSSDVSVALLLYALVPGVQSKKLGVAEIAFYGVLGGLAIWFSHPAVFVLAGLGTSMTLGYGAKKQWAEMNRLLAVCLCWFVSFAAFYFVSLKDLSHRQYLQVFWSNTFFPLFPKTTSDFRWFWETFFGYFDNPIRLFPPLASLLYLLGIFSMVLKKRTIFFLLISPLFFLILASGLHKYPFSRRLLLFSVPFALLFIAEGAEFMRAKMSGRLSILGMGIIGLLISPPFFQASYHLVRPRTHDEIKPVMHYMRDHWRHGDFIYVYSVAKHPFRYYQEKYNFKESDFLIGKRRSENNRYLYNQDFDPLREKQRIWVLFTRFHRKNAARDRKFILHHLDQIGENRDLFEAPKAAVYLYNFRKDSLK